VLTIIRQTASSAAGASSAGASSAGASAAAFAAASAAFFSAVLLLFLRLSSFQLPDVLLLQLS